MKKRLTWLGAAAALCLAAQVASAQPQLPGQRPSTGPGPGPAPSQGGTVQRINVQQAAQVLQQAGYQNVQVKENVVYATVNGAPVILLLQACEQGSCGVMWFVTILGEQSGIDQNYVAAWHDSIFTGRLYRSPTLQNQLVFDYAVFLLNGVPASYLVDNAKIYGALLQRLMQFRPGQQQQQQQ